MKLSMPLLLRGDARALPLPDDSVDLVVTSPPYFGLRSYSDNGEHYTGQIGSEPTPVEFLDALIACTAEMVRVLKPSGSMFVNLGDSYYSGKGAPGKTTTDPKNAGRNARREGRSPLDAPGLGIPRKSLVLLPERYRIRCVDDLGLTVRAVIVWSKPNGLPESVTDRVRRSHEDWVHLTLAPRYFSAVDEIRSPANATGRADRAAPRGPALGPELRAAVRTDDGATTARGWCLVGPLQDAVRSAVAADAQGFQVINPVGFHMRIETPERNYVVDLDPVVRSALGAVSPVAVHDALAKLSPAGSAPGLVAARPAGVLLTDVVLDDTAGRAEVLDFEVTPIATEGIAARIAVNLYPGRATFLVWDALAAHHSILPQKSIPLGKLPGSVWEIPTQPLNVPGNLGIQHFAAFPMAFPRRIIQGWSPPAGVVLDPFSGTGTTALVATMLGRHGIGVDMSADYNRLAQWRCADPKERARAAGLDPDAVSRIHQEAPGQGDLFGEGDAA